VRTATLSTISDTARRSATLLAALALCAFGAGCGDADGLGGDDQDGIVGGNHTFLVTVTDTAFSPPILKTQNFATVNLTLTNMGTTPHGFAIACMGAACFPDGTTIQPVMPGESGTAMFETPRTEGIYDINSNVPGETISGQFIIQ